MNDELTILPLELSYNRPGHCDFREQIAVLHRVHINHDEGTVTFLRSFIEVCQPGSASLDPDNPGEDTAAAWERMDQLITSGGVGGFFHTHPSGIHDWSCQDILAQNGIAKATGCKRILHGVQAAGSGRSKFVYCCMFDHRVFRFECDTIEDDLTNPVVIVKIPPDVLMYGRAYCLQA